MCSREQRRRVWTSLGVVCLVLTGGRLSAGESPWYVVAQFGVSSAEAQFGSRHPKWVDDGAVSGAIEVGYTAHRHLAVEVGYHDLGSHRGWGSPCRESEDACIERLAGLGLCVEGSECTEVLVTLDAEISGFSLALVPSWPLGERFAIRGKVGLMAWDSDVSGLVGPDLNEGFSGEELLAGIGVQYTFPGGLGLVIQYEQMDLDVSTTSLGVSWRF